MFDRYAENKRGERRKNGKPDDFKADRVTNTVACRTHCVPPLGFPGRPGFMPILGEVVLTEPQIGVCGAGGKAQAGKAALQSPQHGKQKSGPKPA
jgi:hypothetical protein